MATSENYQKLTERVNRLEVEIKEVREDVKKLEDLKETSITLKAQYSYIAEVLDEVKNDVKELKEKPTKFIDCTISAILAALATFIVMKFFG